MTLNTETVKGRRGPYSNQEQPHGSYSVPIVFPDASINGRKPGTTYFVSVGIAEEYCDRMKVAERVTSGTTTEPKPKPTEDRSMAPPPRGTGPHGTRKKKGD